jgi:ferrous iron transport protein A
MLLKDVRKGQAVEVVSVDLAEDQCFRLREMGISPGSKLQVSQRSAFGSRIIARGAERIAVDAKCAKCIQVKQRDEPTASDTIAEGTGDVLV